MCYIEKLKEKVKIKYPSININDFGIADLERLDSMKIIPKTDKEITTKKIEEK